MIRRKVRKLTHSIESSDPKLLAVISKAQTGEELKSDFEYIEAYILPHDFVANNKDASNKNEKQNVPDTCIVSIIGGRNQQTKLDLRFYSFREYKTLSENDKSVFLQ